MGMDTDLFNTAGTERIEKIVQSAKFKIEEGGKHGDRDGREGEDVCPLLRIWVIRTRLINAPGRSFRPLFLRVSGWFNAEKKKR